MLRQFLGWTKSTRYAIDDALYKAYGDQSALVELRDIYKGQPMLVVGNGPSLNKTPLDEFAHIPSIGMNKIDLIFKRVAWRPNLIVCVNTMVVKQHARHFASSDIPVYLSWKSRWFAKSGPSVSFFNMSLSEDFSDDIAQRVGGAATVTYPALQFAYYMGADPVILVGIDHNFDKTGKENAYEKRKGADINHFDPNYFKDGAYWGLPNLVGSERVYWQAKAVFESANRRIFDATVDGKLEVFPKISIDEAIGMV